MIKSLTVTNHLGESLVLELEFPEKSGFSVRKIDGLEPPTATINTREVFSSDGAIFNSVHVNSRNIVISLGFCHIPTIEDVRQKSYKYFPIGKEVTLTIETDNRVCQTTGWVEKNDTDIFNSSSGCLISVMCPNSYFYSQEKTVTVFSSLIRNFEFPFSNESLVSRLLEMSLAIDTPEKPVVYIGDATIGVTVYIHAIGDVTDFAIFNRRTRQTIRLNHARLVAMTGYGIIDGDDIVISTVKGLKSITLQRNGMYYNIINCLEKNTGWFELDKGDNLFLYTMTSGRTNLQIRIEHQTAYEGI